MSDSAKQWNPTCAQIPVGGEWAYVHKCLEQGLLMAFGEFRSVVAKSKKEYVDDKPTDETYSVLIFRIEIAGESRPFTLYVPEEYEKDFSCEKFNDSAKLAAKGDMVLLPVKSYKWGKMGYAGVLAECPRVVAGKR